LLFVGLLLLEIGCGSGSQTSTTSATANPGTSTPASSNPPASSSQPPTPTPAPAPTPTPASSSDSYLAAITLTIGKNPTNHGQVTIDTTANNGAGSVQLSNVGFTNVQLQFCPKGVNSACTNVGAPFSTDASNNANVNFTFPEKGTFSGVWQIVSSGCTNGCQQAASTIGDSGVGFMSAELPAGSISGGIGQATGNAPGSGKITVTNSVAHLTLSGTTANHTFHVSLCGDPQGVGCAALSDVTTDSNGNASADIGTVQAFGSSVFEVTDSAGVEFISAFRVQ
jgi:hypothetical protein